MAITPRNINLSRLRSKIDEISDSGLNRVNGLGVMNGMIVSAGAMSPFPVGPTELYHTIQDAVIAAITAGVSSTNPATIFVQPGVYTGDVTIVPGLTVASTCPEKGYTTQLNGHLIYNSAVIGGVANSHIAQWVCIDVTSPNTAAALQFLGTNPQRLNVSKCEFNAGATANAAIMSNTGSGSVLVTFDVNFNQVGTGVAVLVERGKLSTFKVQANSVGNQVAIRLNNASQLEGFMTYCTGQVELNGTANGLADGFIISAAANPLFVMNSSSVLATAGTLCLGSGVIAGGSNVPGVVGIGISV